MRLKNTGTKEIEKIFPEINMLSSEEWAKKVCSVWKEVFEDSKWEKIEDAKHNSMTPWVTLVDHTRAVALLALDFIKNLEDIFKTKADKDVLIASSLLHDVCKLVELEPAEDGGFKKSTIGERYQHGFLSAYYALKAGFPEAVIANLINHTRDSRTIPRTIEGVVLYYADSVVADCQRIVANAPLLISKGG